MHKVQLIIKLLLQLGIIIVITYIGTEIQKIFHLPLAGSIVGLFYFIYYYNLRLYRSLGRRRCKLFIKDDGLFFIPSVVGIMDVASEITLNYILFFAVIIIGTCIVALSSGYIAEKCLLNISNVKV